MNYMENNKWLICAENLYRTKKLLKKYEDKQIKLLEELKKISGYKSYSFKQFIFAMEKRKGVIDYSKIKILKKINLELYRKDPVQVWRLTKV